MMNSINIFFFLVVLGLVGYALYLGLCRWFPEAAWLGKLDRQSMDHRTFLEGVQKGHILAVTLNTAVSALSAVHRDGNVYWVELPAVDTTWMTVVKDRNIPIQVSARDPLPLGAKLLLCLLAGSVGLSLPLPYLSRYLSRSSRSGVEAPAVPEKTVTFADIGGYVDEKRRLSEWIGFLRSPERFEALRARVSKGVVIEGPPGTGKKLLARAVAGEANAKFLRLPATDLRDVDRISGVFAEAKQQAPCVLFIEDLDTADTYGRASLRQLLRELDALDHSSASVLVIGSICPDDHIPQALLRPGRFQRRIVLELPDRIEREAILQLQTQTVPLTAEVDLAEIAKKTVYWSGAKLAQLVFNSRVGAERAGRSAIAPVDFEQAQESGPWGSCRISRDLTDEAKARIAYDLAGRAIIESLLPDRPPVEGVTMLPSRESEFGRLRLGISEAWETQQSLEHDLAVAYGGLIAEELVYGKRGVSTLGAPAIAWATNLARRMVTQEGFSDRLGPIRYRKAGKVTETAIETEVKCLLDRVYGDAYRLLSENLDILHAMQAALVRHETLNAEQIAQLMARKPLAAESDGSQEGVQGAVA